MCDIPFFVFVQKNLPRSSKFWQIQGPFFHAAGFFFLFHKFLLFFFFGLVLIVFVPRRKEKPNETKIGGEENKPREMKGGEKKTIIQNCTICDVKKRRKGEWGRRFNS